MPLRWNSLFHLRPANLRTVALPVEKSQKAHRALYLLSSLAQLRASRTLTNHREPAMRTTNVTVC